MENKKEPLLKVEHLCQYFKMGRGELKAVHDVSFDIYPGEVFGLVGESGCGKTTTGRSIIKLYDITSGNIYFKGQRISAGTRSYKKAILKANQEYSALKKELDQDNKLHPENAALNKEKLKQEFNKKNKIVNENKKQIALANYDQKHCDHDYSRRQQKLTKEKYLPLLEQENDLEKKKQLNKQYRDEMRMARKTRLVTQIQMIFQDPIGSLNPRMTVEEIIKEGLIIQGVRDKKILQEKVYDVLDKVGLVKEHATRYPHEFSGGQRQRIGIARSIIMNPDLIIADEPVSALDVSIQAQVINLINDLRRELGLTVLFIAHDLSVVKYFSDRIGVMYYGDLVELASSDEIFAHPLHPYTKSLLSAIPLPDPIYERQRRRIVYNPVVSHDYTVNKPSLREIAPHHFVFCNDEEEKRYKEELANAEKKEKYPQRKSARRRKH